MPDNHVYRESFFVGGAYTGAGPARVMRGQMYVEALIPETILHPFPLVLIHGNGQTGMNWMTTPDGRRGWGPWFAEQGWKVYVVDQPARGRSAWQPDIDQTPTSYSVSFTERVFTAPEAFDLWPQARLHTQWPGGGGKGRAGDPVFDQFYAGQVPSIDSSESDALMLAAGPALLDRIGPAVLITHSQSGILGWMIADACPDLVKGIVALEPRGPPFRDVHAMGRSDRQWGLAGAPLTYDPAVTPEHPIEFEQEAGPDAPGLVACWVQRGKPRRLANLAKIPVFVVTGQASHHAAYDHCTVRYLVAAGVPAEHCRLEDRHVMGNGHFVMLEENSSQIAEIVADWIRERVRQTGCEPRARS